MKGLILSAGYGTRLRPITSNLPKPLVKICNRTVIEHIIEKFKKISIEDIAINLHHLGDKIVDFLNSKDFQVKFHFFYEDEILDTGGAVKNIRDFVGDDYLLVHNGDIVSEFDLTEIINWHKVEKNDVTLCVMERKSTRMLVFDEKMFLNGWINGERNLYRGRVKGVKYSFTGIHIISPSIYKFMPAENKFPIFDFYMNNLGNINIRGYPVKPNYWFDIGSIEKLNEARKFFKEHPYFSV